MLVYHGILFIAKYAVDQKNVRTIYVQEKHGTVSMLKKTKQTQIKTKKKLDRQSGAAECI